MEADAGQLEQVIVNLAVNAHDAMPTGGQLTFQTGTVDVPGPEVAADEELHAGRYVMLSVGHRLRLRMDAVVQAHAFEPFFTTKEPGKGTGLGLSAVYGIIRQAGGSILLDSAPGRGTTFRILLPAAGKLARPTETILLVEDDSILRGLARRTLQRAGYAVLEASSPREALRIAL